MKLLDKNKNKFTFWLLLWLIFFIVCTARIYFSLQLEGKKVSTLNELPLPTWGIVLFFSLSIIFLVFVSVIISYFIALIFFKGTSFHVKHDIKRKLYLSYMGGYTIYNILYLLFTLLYQKAYQSSQRQIVNIFLYLFISFLIIITLKRGKNLKLEKIVEYALMIFLINSVIFIHPTF